MYESGVDNAVIEVTDTEKTTPKYQDSAAELQKNYIAAWKNVINSAIALEQEYAIAELMTIKDDCIKV